MLAGTYKITCDQGSVYERVFTILNSDDTAFNLTGYIARMQVRPEIESSTVMLSLTSPSGGLVLGGVAGTISLSITAAQTAGLTTDGVYDLEIQSTTGKVYRLLKGSFVVRPEVTR